MRLVNDFNTDDPVQLDRELNQLEENIDEETRSIRASFEPILQPVRFVARTAQTIFAGLFGQQVSVDTSIASATLVIRAVNSKDFGRRLVVIKPSALNTLTIVCQDTTALLNGAAFSLAITAAGVTVFYCDSSGFYK